MRTVRQASAAFASVLAVCLCVAGVSAQQEPAAIVGPDTSITFQAPESTAGIAQYRIAIWTDPMPVIKGVLPCDPAKGCPDPSTWTPAPHVVFTRDLGPLAPDAANAITVPVGWTLADLAALDPGLYSAHIEAVGTDGRTWTDATLAFLIPDFGDPGLPVPRSPSRPKNASVGPS